MRRVFTLIELLVVVSIMILLMSLLLPALRNARDKGVELDCCGKVKQITLATSMYAADYDGYGPLGMYVGNVLYLSDINGGIGAYLGINKDYYIGGPKYRIMPPNTICPKGARYGDASPYFGSLYPDGAHPNMNNSYAINYYLSSGDPTNELRNSYAKSFRRVENPSGRMLACTVGIDYWNNPSTARGGYCEDRDVMAFRHNKGGNIGFVDGHVKYIKRDNVPIYGSANDPEFFWRKY